MEQSANDACNNIAPAAEAEVISTAEAEKLSDEQIQLKEDT